MDLVERTALTCQEMDPDIVTDSLLVEARRHPRKTRFQGWAHPEYWSIFRGTSRIHMDGRIQIVVGDRVRTTDVIRVIAHELRHIGQFHRGQELTGELTQEPLSDAECEDDAYGFEYTMLDRLGVVYP